MATSNNIKRALAAARDHLGTWQALADYLGGVAGRSLTRQAVHAWHQAGALPDAWVMPLLSIAPVRKRWRAEDLSASFKKVAA